MKTAQKFILAIAIGTIITTACKKDDDPVKTPPPVTHEPELITSLVLIFTDSANTADIRTAAFRDPDGPGGNAPAVHDTIKLSANSTYFVKLDVLDETKNPADTISHEVDEERDEHQFFFDHTGVAVTTVYLDSDSNGYPVGLSTKWRTGGGSAGTSRVQLKHQPGTKNGTDVPGETDVDVIFQAKVN